MVQNTLNFEEFTHLDAEWRAELSRELKPFCRKHVADELSKLTGHSVSEAVLNNWTSPANGNYRTPAVMVAPLCHVLERGHLYEWLGKPIRQLLNRNRLEELARLQDEKRRIENRLAELEGRV